MDPDIDTSNPVQPGKQPGPKAVLWLSILMILLFLYQLYSQFNLLWYMLTGAEAKWDFAMAMYFIRPLVIMPVALVLFLLRKNSGWVLLSGYLTYMGINAITVLYAAITQHHDDLAPPPSLDPLIGWGIFTGGCLYFVYKRDVRAMYNINRKSILMTLIVGVLLVLTSIIK